MVKRFQSQDIGHWGSVRVGQGLEFGLCMFEVSRLLWERPGHSNVGGLKQNVRVGFRSMFYCNHTGTMRGPPRLLVIPTPILKPCLASQSPQAEIGLIEVSVS